MPTYILAAILAFILMFTPAAIASKRNSVVGIASWYGKREAGKEMANGHPFDPNKLTCASRTYPFGTRLRVTYPTTGKSVIVVVTDRGPWIKGRILDLSEAAAKVIGLRGYGIGLVIIEPITEEIK
jgi:rare lipoprotein A